MTAEGSPLLKVESTASLTPDRGVGRGRRSRGDLVGSPRVGSVPLGALGVLRRQFVVQVEHGVELVSPSTSVSHARSDSPGVETSPGRPSPRRIHFYRDSLHTLQPESELA